MGVKQILHSTKAHVVQLGYSQAFLLQTEQLLYLREKNSFQIHTAKAGCQTQPFSSETGPVWVGSLAHKLRCTKSDVQPAPCHWGQENTSPRRKCAGFVLTCIKVSAWLRLQGQFLCFKRQLRSEVQFQEHLFKRLLSQWLHASSYIKCNASSGPPSFPGTCLLSCN